MRSSNPFTANGRRLRSLLNNASGQLLQTITRRTIPIFESCDQDAVKASRADTTVVLDLISYPTFVLLVSVRRVPVAQAESELLLESGVFRF